MQDAETVLGVIRERGRRGLPLERLYRQFFNPQLFLRAYGRLYANQGAMTPGVTRETVDGMSVAKIGAIIGRLRSESYRWSPRVRAKSALRCLTCGYGGQQPESDLMDHHYAFHVHREHSSSAQVK